MVAMATPKAARWLDLIAFLLYHRAPVTREEIFRKVAGYVEPGSPLPPGAGTGMRESARRKFERDKDELRALGIEIETVDLAGAAGNEPGVGYRLRPQRFYLPYLELDAEAGPGERPYAGLERIRVSPEELALLDRATQRIAQRAEAPLAAAARSVRHKLEFDLPLPLGAVERALARPLDDETAASLEVLQRAVAERTAVSCRYYAIGRDADAVREIEPYGLFFSWGRWYCVARARDRDARRVFRVDRMRETAMLKGRAAQYAVPEGFDVRVYVGRAPWELSERAPTRVRVRFHFPESRWVQAQGVGTVVEPLLEDGGAILDFAVRDVPPFLRWLLTFRRQAAVLEPTGVARELEQLRRRVAAIYE